LPCKVDPFLLHFDSILYDFLNLPIIYCVYWYIIINIGSYDQLVPEIFKYWLLLYMHIHKLYEIYSFWIQYIFIFDFVLKEVTNLLCLSIHLHLYWTVWLVWTINLKKRTRIRWKMINNMTWSFGSKWLNQIELDFGSCLLFLIFLV
jgi:hypothetical protein